MNSLDAASLVNLLGFSVAIALYGLLAVMVLRHRRAETVGVNRLLMATALLGLLWNIGELLLRVQRDFGGSTTSPLLEAVSYSALGFLPSVVVHLAQREMGKTYWLSYAAYLSSLLAAALHFQSYLTDGPAPSVLALKILTFSAVTLALGLA